MQCNPYLCYNSCPLGYNKHQSHFSAFFKGFLKPYQSAAQNGCNRYLLRQLRTMKLASVCVCKLPWIVEVCECEDYLFTLTSTSTPKCPVAKHNQSSLMRIKMPLFSSMQRVIMKIFIQATMKGYGIIGSMRAWGGTLC